MSESCRSVSGFDGLLGREGLNGAREADERLRDFDWLVESLELLGCCGSGLGLNRFGIERRGLALALGVRPASISASEFGWAPLRVERNGTKGVLGVLSGDEVASACCFCDCSALLLPPARPRVCRGSGTLILLTDISASCFRFFAGVEGLSVQCRRFCLVVELCS